MRFALIMRLLCANVYLLYSAARLEKTLNRRVQTNTIFRATIFSFSVSDIILLAFMFPSGKVDVKFTWGHLVFLVGHYRRGFGKLSSCLRGIAPELVVI